MTERASDSRRLLPGDGASSRGARAAGRMNRAKPTTVRRPSAAAKPSGGSLRAAPARQSIKGLLAGRARPLKGRLRDIVNLGVLKSIVFLQDMVIQPRVHAFIAALGAPCPAEHLGRTG